MHAIYHAAIQHAEMHLLIAACLVLPALAQDLSLPTCYRDSRLSRARRLEGLKQEILQRLGLEKEPCNPANATDVKDPEFLKEYALIKESWELGDVPKPPCASLDFDTMEVVPFRPVSVEKKKRSTRIADHVECPSDLDVEFYNIYTVKFNIDLRGYDYFTDAQLRLRISRLDINRTATTNQMISEDQIDVKFLIAAENYYGELYKRFVASRRLRSDTVNEMLTFNVTRAIEWWLDFNKGNLTNEITFELHIRCSRMLPEGTKFVPNFQFFSRSEGDARLVITTYKRETVQESTEQESETRRRKRYDVNSGLTFCSTNQIECCLNELEINFERDFNWTWVLRPKQIAFNYCSGECPLRWGRSTRHSQLLERFRARVKRNPAAAAEPCCVPNQYLSLTLAVFLDGVRRIDLLEDIVATSCACR